MKLVDKYRYNKLIKEGYIGEQANEIVKLLNDYPRAIMLIDKTYSPDDIKEVHKLYSTKDIPLIIFLSNLEPQKRILIVKAYNKNEGPFARADRTWELITTIATNYDADVLRIFLEQIMVKEPNYVLLNLVRTAMDQNVDLNDLDFFKKNKVKTK